MSLFAPEIKSAFLSGLPLDAILLFLGAIITDGGVFGATLWNAVIGAMILKAYIAIRRPKKPTKYDLIWIRSGAVFMIPVSIVATIYFSR